MAVGTVADIPPPTHHWLWFIIAFFVALLFVGLYFYYLVWRNSNSSTTVIETRGANLNPAAVPQSGTSGGISNLLNMKFGCPTGLKIQFNTPTYIDGSTTTACDPYLADPTSATGVFNPATTLPATDLIKACEGQNSCTFSFPQNLELPGSCGGANTQLIATYNCIK
jgi:hypothetical protein